MQTRITLDLANIKWIKRLMWPRISLLPLAVFRADTGYNYKERIKILHWTALCRAMLWKGALLTLGMMSLTIVLQSQIHITTLHWTALMAESSCHYKKTFSLFTSFFYYAQNIHNNIRDVCQRILYLSSLIKAWIDTEESENNLCVNSIAEWCQRKNQGGFLI